MSAESLKLWRTQAVPNHYDAPNDIDHLTPERAYQAAAYYGPLMLPFIQPVHDSYQNVKFKACNETGGHNRQSLLNMQQYQIGLIDFFTPLGIDLALWGCAGGDPSFELWEEFVVPVLQHAIASGGQHVYTRNVYGGVPDNAPNSLTDQHGRAQTDNSKRPFLEARYLADNAIYIPIVLGEQGQCGGSKTIDNIGIDELVRDHIAYDKLLNLPEHWLILSGCMWSYGIWNSPLDNIQDASPQLAEYLRQTKPYTLADIQAKILSAETGEVNQPMPTQPPAPQIHPPAHEPAPTNQHIRDLPLQQEFKPYSWALYERVYKDGFRPIDTEKDSGTTRYLDAVDQHGSIRRYFCTIGLWHIVDYHILKITLIDVVDQLRKHPHKAYSNRPLTAVTTITYHHTVGVTTPQGIANYHVSTKEWPGAAYHVFIDTDGSAYLLNRLTTRSYHDSNNTDSIGIAFNGDFRKQAPNQKMLDAAKLVTQLLAELLPNKLQFKGHRERPNNETVCPGNALLAHIPSFSAESQPSIQTYNLKEYFTGNQAYYFRTHKGEQELCWYKWLSETEVWLVKNTGFEQNFFDGKNWYRGWDTTQSAELMYRQQQSPTNTTAAFWIEQHVTINQQSIRNPWVQHFLKSKCQPTEAKDHVVSEIGVIWQGAMNLGGEYFEDCLQIGLPNGEQYIGTKDERAGLIRWSDEDGRWSEFHEFANQKEGEQPKVSKCLQALM